MDKDFWKMMISSKNDKKKEYKNKVKCNIV